MSEDELNKCVKIACELKELLESGVSMCVKQNITTKIYQASFRNESISKDAILLEDVIRILDEECKEYPVD